MKIWRTLIGTGCILISTALAAPDAGTRSDAGVGAPFSLVRDGGRPGINFKWDVPNVVSEVDMPGITWAVGVPVKMHAVTVKGKIEDTMRYMYESFVKQGLVVEARLQQGNILTGVDPDTLVTYSAVFQQNAPGYVSVVLGEANVLKVKKPQGNDIVPLFPGASSVLRNSFEGVDSLVYVVVGGDEAKVKEFYRDIMPKSRFTPLPGDGLSFQKTGEHVSIVTAKKDGNVSVFVTRRQRASP